MKVSLFPIPKFFRLLALLVPMLSFPTLAQDSSFTKKKVTESDIQTVMSFYTQDGNHSAITGGTGTENLQVYSFKVSSTKVVDQKNQWLLGFGTDIITSASTDKIDFEVSSASRHDLHTTLSGGYARNLQDGKYELGGELLFSFESDYFSRGGALWFIYNQPDLTRSLSFHFQAFWDDLRWGRFKKPYLVEAITLIYPQELRNQDWFDIHDRYSYNFNFSYRQDLNPRMSLTLYPSYSYQQGLLSTPFHRVYFVGQERPKVENLPRQRSQYAVGAQLNSFVSKRLVLRSFYQFYTDDFGISSHTARLETPYKLKPNLSLAPFVRLAAQQGSRYFEPYKQHVLSDVFYSSDYDLSTFSSASVGLSLRVLRLKSIPQGKRGLAGWNLRYSYYSRSDGLYAHMVSLFFDLPKKSAPTK